MNTVLVLIMDRIIDNLIFLREVVMLYIEDMRRKNTSLVYCSNEIAEK